MGFRSRGRGGGSFFDRFGRRGPTSQSGVLASRVVFQGLDEAVRKVEGALFDEMVGVAEEGAGKVVAAEVEDADRGVLPLVGDHHTAN